MPNASTPYFLRPHETHLAEGPDKTLEPTFPPTDPARRSAPPLNWPRFDTSKGPKGPPDRPAGPRPTDPALRALPPFSWPGAPAPPNRPLGETEEPLTLDPDIALWPVVPVSLWPFAGAPTTGRWPKQWLGIDNTATVYVCTVGGSPGTWAVVGGAGALYASLTGAGQSASPGKLTQAGAFAVNDHGETDGISFLSTGAGGFSVDSDNAVILTSENEGVTIESLSLSNVEIQAANAAVQIASPGVYIGSPAGEVSFQNGLGGTLGFFGASGHAQISGASITTLAQLVTALQDYGLLG